MTCPGIIADALDATVLQRLLTTRTFGRFLHILGQTASTNDDAKLLAQRGAPEGTVVLAEQQTRGRGRQGRSFASPAGVGIYLSLIVRPDVSPTRLPQLTLVVAVATAEAIAEACALPVGLKWPNDVEISGKKVAGILTEAMLCPGGSWQRVTSLALATGSPFSRPPLMARLLAQLERLYDTFQQGKFASILERWRHYGCVTGRAVQFTDAADVREGIVVGVDDDGALLVQAVSGNVQRVIAGEVVFL
jgi:BirA family biotin operon repressor/biotin-[acetyl-CoA-carboxylase] ligase